MASEPDNADGGPETTVPVAVEPGAPAPARERRVRNPGAAVYGAITAGALLAAESPKRETYPRTVIAVVVALLLYWLAHAYADLVDDRLREGHQLSLEGIVASMVEEVWILAGAVPALAVVGVEAAIGASLPAAVVAAIWTSGGVIVVFEVAVGVRAHMRPVKLVVQTLTGAALGLLVVLLRLVLH